jgi:hypothetical protein
MLGPERRSSRELDEAVILRVRKAKLASSSRILFGGFSEEKWVGLSILEDAKLGWEGTRLSFSFGGDELLVLL